MASPSMASPNAPMDVSDDKSPAEQAKEEGNALFKAQKYAEAVSKYNDAIELDPEVPAYYTKCAAAAH